jgi:hypothetical protein
MRPSLLLGLVALLGCGPKRDPTSCPHIDSPYYASVELETSRHIIYDTQDSLCVGTLRRNEQSGPARVLDIHLECTDMNDLYSGTFRHTETFDLDADGFEDLHCLLEGYEGIVDYQTQEDHLAYYFTDTCTAVNLQDQVGMDILEESYTSELYSKRQ